MFSLTSHHTQPPCVIGEQARLYDSCTKPKKLNCVPFKTTRGGEHTQAQTQMSHWEPPRLSGTQSVSPAVIKNRKSHKPPVWGQVGTTAVGVTKRQYWLCSEKEVWTDRPRRRENKPTVCVCVCLLTFHSELNVWNFIALRSFCALPCLLLHASSSSSSN